MIFKRLSLCRCWRLQPLANQPRLWEKYTQPTGGRSQVNPGSAFSVRVIYSRRSEVWFVSELLVLSCRKVERFSLSSVWRLNSLQREMKAFLQRDVDVVFDEWVRGQDRISPSIHKTDGEEMYASYNLISCETLLTQSIEMLQIQSTWSSSQKLQKARKVL